MLVCAHNLVIVKIKKSYPGQGMKVISSLSGAGQMMFTKYMVVVSGDVDIRNYKDLISHIFINTDLSRDLIFNHGPLDVLDHCSDNFSFGGKLGVDATIKLPEESSGRKNAGKPDAPDIELDFFDRSIISDFNNNLLSIGIPVVIVSVDRSHDRDIIEKAKKMFLATDLNAICSLILVVDHTVDVTDLFMVPHGRFLVTPTRNVIIGLSPPCQL